MLYTTVTVSDFSDTHYIQKLQELEVGIELALLAKLSDTPQEKDLIALQEEIEQFLDCFDQFNIPLHEVRIHQPGGYFYNWSEGQNFDGLKDFFLFCAQKGFKQFVIHTPYGSAAIDQDAELKIYREKLQDLAACVHQLEVEEITASCSGERCYNGKLFENLMYGQKATVLLDVHECGGVEKTVKRLAHLQTNGFAIKSIHIHKDKHKFLTPEELNKLLQSGFSGDIVNEGFIKADGSFDQFVQTKSLDLVVANDQRVEIIRGYKDLIGLN